MHVPTYDMSTRTRKRGLKIRRVHVVVLEGIFVLYWQALRDLSRGDRDSESLTDIKKL